MIHTKKDWDTGEERAYFDDKCESCQNRKRDDYFGRVQKEREDALPKMITRSIIVGILLIVITIGGVNLGLPLVEAYAFGKKADALGKALGDAHYSGTDIKQIVETIFGKK